MPDGECFINVELPPGLDGARTLVGWMLAAFLVTFLVTRLITRAIRRGGGGIRDTVIAGVHVHHQVYGIFLMLAAGTAEFTYRPDTPWLEVLAVMFGVGAALTLDGFALWLRLDDVYWGREGRQSVEAVLIAVFAVVAILKGRTVLGIIGVLLPVAAIRLARPGSPWAHRWYRPGSRRLVHAQRRFPEGARSTWDPLVDFFARPVPKPVAAAPAERGLER